MYKRAKLGLGYLPQEPSIFRKLSVEDNIMAVLELNNALDKNIRKERLEALLVEFHITHIRHLRGLSLSGGERRRVEIARAHLRFTTFGNNRTAVQYIRIVASV
jgi:lipopolysaccharide export system ATP-binding protein